jgi:metal-responsive CopG/Arc/MetJ family transcriptional regulator
MHLPAYVYPVMTKVNEDTLRQIDEVSQKVKVSKSKLIRTAIEEYIAKKLEEC